MCQDGTKALEEDRTARRQERQERRHTRKTTKVASTTTTTFACHTFDRTCGSSLMLAPCHGARRCVCLCVCESVCVCVCVCESVCVCQFATCTPPLPPAQVFDCSA